MDTATHFVIGVSIAGLATSNPIVAQDPTLSQSILIGALIASQAPDFDGISRFFGGTANYVKNHRGITHSLPALFIWPILITMVLFLFSPTVSFPQLWFWTFLSVTLHVFLDLFNAYGTQVLRPFSEKWVSFNIINIFDPFIFVVHILGIIMWALSIYSSIYIFSTVFILTFTYIIWRTWKSLSIKKYLREILKTKGKITLLPTINWNIWNVINELDNQYKIGVLKGKKLNWEDQKIKASTHDSIEAAMKDKKITNFLYFTRYAYGEWKKTPYGYEVKFEDLRYRFQNHYPFIAIALLDESYHILDSYVGWVYNKDFIEKKIYSILREEH